MEISGFVYNGFIHTKTTQNYKLVDFSDSTNISVADAGTTFANSEPTGTISSTEQTTEQHRLSILYICDLCNSTLRDSSVLPAVSELAEQAVQVLTAQYVISQYNNKTESHHAGKLFAECA